MKWYKRFILGNTHHEFRNEDNEKYAYWFDIEVTPSDRITLYTFLPHTYSHYINFKSLKDAKKIALASINNSRILKPYIDHEWIKMGEEFVKLIAKANKVLKT